MNQINPLHIGGLLLVVLVFVIFNLNGEKKDLIEAKLSYKVSEKVAVDLKSLKDVYANKKQIKNSINRILSQASLKTAKFLLTRKKESINIVSKSMDAKTLNTFMSKILNASYNISRLKIKKLSRTKASLDMEIKW